MTTIYGDTRAQVAVADMTVERALEIINSKHARSPLSPDDVFIFSMTLSNQEVDSYHTRMHRTSLNNYAVDFSEGRAFMNSHRTGGWLGSGELPMGRIFTGQVDGDPLPDSARYEDKGGAALRTLVYVQRGLRLTDVATDDFIKGVEGGTVRDTSIGFSLSDGGLYRCSICREDMLDWMRDDGCTHIPGANYDEGRAFAWIENAHGREGSAVYCHATPKTYIDKAIRMADTGKLARRDALMLEEEWGARIVSGRSFPLAPVAPAQAVEKRVSEGAADAPGSLALTTASAGPVKYESPVAWNAHLGEIRAFDAGLADALVPLSEGARVSLLVGALRSRVAEGAALKAKAELGDKWVESLIQEAVAARTRAEGVGKFDAEKYAEVLRKSGDPEFIKGEIASWKRRSGEVFGDGRRPTLSAVPRTTGQRARVYRA